MIFERHLSLSLPSTLGPPLPTSPLEGLERLLFSGSWSRRAATCTLSGAVVLARCHAALRDAGASGFEVDSDAAELVDLRIGSERWGESPPPWAEALPPRWLSEPCAFRLRASWEENAFGFAVQLRHQPRHDAEIDGLVGAIRAAWVPPPRQADLGRDLRATFDDRAALRTLRDALRAAGEQVSESVAGGLASRFERSPITWGEVLVLHQEEARGRPFADRLQGLPPRAIDALPHLAALAAAGGTWQALNERGVPGRLVAGRFHPVAEVLDVV